MVIRYCEILDADYESGSRNNVNTIGGNVQERYNWRIEQVIQNLEDACTMYCVPMRKSSLGGNAPSGCCHLKLALVSYTTGTLLLLYKQDWSKRVYIRLNMCVGLQRIASVKRCAVRDEQQFGLLQAQIVIKLDSGQIDGVPMVRRKTSYPPPDRRRLHRPDQQPGDDVRPTQAEHRCASNRKSELM